MPHKRVGFRLDDHHYRKVADRAAEKGVSMAAVIREAIDHLPTPTQDQRAAIAAILAAEPMELPDDPADLRRELDDAHDRFPG